MPAVKMLFAVHLTSFVYDHMYPSGPIFSRFLPDGEADAVYLTPEGDPHEIRVWFARKARLQNGFLRWDSQGTEFDPAIMRRQGKLDGGYLFGKMTMPDASEAEVTAMNYNPKAPGEQFGMESAEDPEYIALAKRLVKKVAAASCSVCIYSARTIRPILAPGAAALGFAAANLG